MEAEKFARNRAIAENAAKKEQQVKDFVAKQQKQQKSKKKGGGGIDEKKQRQAKERRAKIGRVGLFAENGHKYKLLSIVKPGTGAAHASGSYKSTNGMSSMMVKDEAVEVGPGGPGGGGSPSNHNVRFKLPSAETLGRAAVRPGDRTPLVEMDGARFGYNGAAAPAVLRDLTLSVDTSSRIGIVGGNGAGKSTLVRLLVGDLEPQSQPQPQPQSQSQPRGANAKGAARSGQQQQPLLCTRHPGMRIAYIAQHHIEALAGHLARTPVEYIRDHYRHRHRHRHGHGHGHSGAGAATAPAAAGASSSSGIAAPSRITPSAARTILGGFGLGGSHALQPIGSLSGGQKARLVMAAAMSSPDRPPHLLVLDEPTNHLDSDSLASLAGAVRAFTGAVAIVSHNQAFLAACCRELWVVRGGAVTVSHATEERSLADLFGEYRQSLHSRELTAAQVQRRVQKQMRERGGRAKQPLTSCC